MIIYDESGEIIENPDLETGWVEVKKSDVVKEHHPAIPIKYHIEERDGKRIRVIDQMPKEAWDEYEEYGIYHPNPKIPADKPTQEERIKALEDQLSAYEAAYAEGVNEA